MNPYLVLGVSLEADDQTIRQAYLAAIKESPPDAHPLRFQAVSQAYEKIKDETRRYKYYLFNQECPGESPLDAFLQQARLQGRPRPLPLDFMKNYLRQCAP
jgi:curved DNA-binding protein CbpA